MSVIDPIADLLTRIRNAYKAMHSTVSVTPSRTREALLKILDEEGISIEHHDMRFAKPLDTKLLDELPKRFTQLITIEDGIIDGGMGSAIAEYYAATVHQCLPTAPPVPS